MPDQQPCPTVVKFGPKQFFQQTPIIAKYIGNGVMYATLIVNAALVCFPQIPDAVKATIAGYSASASLFVKTVCAGFGIQLTDTVATPSKN